jgi:hypothetical protein
MDKVIPGNLDGHKITTPNGFGIEDIVILNMVAIKNIGDPDTFHPISGVMDHLVGEIDFVGFIRRDHIFIKQRSIKIRGLSIISISEDSMLIVIQIFYEPSSSDEITGFIRILIRTGRALHLLIRTRHALHPLANLRFLT